MKGEKNNTPPPDIAAGSIVRPDAWAELRRLTSARIAMGRAGGSAPTAAMLEFQFAHAAARDAVHAQFDAEALKSKIEDLISEISNLKSQISDSAAACLIVRSAAPDSKTFLLRPDLGRRLDDESRPSLAKRMNSLKLSQSQNAEDPPANPQRDLVIIVSDGLSALAVHRQTIPLLRALLLLLIADEWRLTPVIIACRGRVAIEDEIGELLGARMALILIGERPGLGSPDSLGAYMVYGPRVGLTDAHRNCVSNIRPEGLPPEQAARTLHYLLTQARRHRLSGVGLKDNSKLLGEATSDPALPERSPS